MVRKAKDSNSKEILAIHQQYIEILNCVPDILYWVDINCALKGCNNAFVLWLGLKRMEDFAGTPYEQMKKFEKCDEARIETFKLDDMAVLFSGEPKYNVEETPLFNKENEPSYFLATRVPLLDKEKHVYGLVVVLKDITAQKKAEESAKAASPEEGTVGPGPKDSPRILMVEDNIIAQKVEEDLLKALNCQIDIADTGEKAVSLFNPGKYDIIFIDMGLQDTSGFMVAKQIRQKEENTEYHVPIIALTAHQPDVMLYDTEEYCMDGVLTKPLTSEQAKQVIQHYFFHEDIPVSGLANVKNKVG